MADSVHPVAGFGFARSAQVYAISRPGYPMESVDWLRDRLGIGPGSMVAEVGAGTGKFTPMLVATGATVIATDPVAEMLAELRSALPEVRTAIAPAQELLFAEASLDALVCATSFHWFASRETLTEFHRVLRPGGALGLIWNIRDVSIPWVAALSDVTNRYEGSASREKSGDWRAPFPATGFTPLNETLMRYDHIGTVEDVVIGRTLSTSFIAALPEDQMDSVMEQVRALVAETPDLAGYGEIAFPYLTTAYDCRRLD